ncbi:hypothetical protein [Klebsiella aerogenes]|uniref:hypothetical protein n=1 Tax=Klebsiella aerogenes TaxID=548 RepID=UPI002278D346|nr:hypothetical protein [Klebsiella aerogenes]MCY4764341.1 hypothetical protein [Klebsiella aerogenes]
MNINDLCNIEILGNVKANQYLKENGKSYIQAKGEQAYKDVACSTADRQKEAMKLKPYIDSGKTNIATICKAVKAAGGSLSPLQIKEWIKGETEAVEVAKQPDGDSVTISRVEWEYYQVMAELTDPDKKQTIRELTAQRLIEKQTQAFIDAVSKQMDGITLP